MLVGMAHESSIVLPVEEAEAIVGHLRERYDPAARSGMPAHITLLYPFVPPIRTAAEIEVLGRLFLSIPEFEFALTDVRHFPATAYLHPDPPDAFVRLTEIITQRWPDYSPYRGAFSTVVPHLTVADHVNRDVLDSVERAVSIHLPIKCRAKVAWLLCSDAQGFWNRNEIFLFGPKAKTIRSRGS